MSTSDLQRDLRKAGLIPKKEVRKQKLAKRIRAYHDSQNFARGFIRDRYWDKIVRESAAQGYDFIEISGGIELRREHEKMMQEAVEADGFMAFFRGTYPNRVFIIDWKERPGQGQ